jgi:hypothetical protein
VEQHLSECAECQAELAELRSLSTLLRETAPDVVFVPTERFAATLMLNLPRAPVPPTRSRQWQELGWWLVPVGLLSVWLFVQITFSLSDAVSFAANSGLLGNQFSWLQGHPPQMEWFGNAKSLFGDQLGVPGRLMLSTLNDAHLAIVRAAGQYVWHVLLATLYLGWFLAWWLRQQTRTAEGYSQVSA